MVIATFDVKVFFKQVDILLRIYLIKKSKLIITDYQTVFFFNDRF